MVEETPEKKEPEKQQKELRNCVLIGNKPISVYILASNRILKNANELAIKARGRSISTAVNLAEILKRDGLKTKDIKINTEKFTTKEGKEISVSGMEINLSK